MRAARVVREVFKSNRVQSIGLNKACEFSDGGKIKMQKCEAPDSPVEEPSLAQHGQYFIVKFFVLEHPKDLLWSEDVGVKDVSGGKEGNYLFLLA